MSLSSFIRNYHNPNSLYINTLDKWLWLRIHKTAGTSMYDAFLKDHCLNIAKPGQSETVRKWINTVTTQELEKYLVWTCVRNPYDRFHSMAAMFKMTPQRLAKEFHFLRRSNSVIQRHTETQHSFTHHNGQQVPNLVMYFEDLQTGFNTVCLQLGLPLFELPQLNATKHGNWQDVFDAKTIDFVNHHFELDFKYFNYKMI